MHESGHTCSLLNARRGCDAEARGLAYTIQHCLINHVFMFPAGLRYARGGGGTTREDVPSAKVALGITSGGAHTRDEFSSSAAPLKF